MLEWKRLLLLLKVARATKLGVGVAILRVLVVVWVCTVLWSGPRGAAEFSIRHLIEVLDLLWSQVVE